VLRTQLQRRGRRARVGETADLAESRVDIDDTRSAPVVGSSFALAVNAMPAVSYQPARQLTWSETQPRAFSLPWARVRMIVLSLATVLAVVFRAEALSTYGLSEDELNKVHAIEQYRAGHFGANAEHPMLMKLAMWGAVGLADAWNRVAPAEEAISLESAIRLPNVLAGAITTVALFGVADVLFGGAVATAVSVIWAFDVNAIAINRIGKEDTFLLLFFLIAVFCYERAKRIGTTDLPTAQRWYTLSGAAFGLMLASKYMPHFLGIYALFNLITDLDAGSNKPDRLRHFGAMAAAFLAANLAVVLPDTWWYVARYVQGDMLAHHGYLYKGALYVTNVPVSPLGVPPTYYLRLLATRVPLVVLAAAVPGAIEMMRRRTERGFVLLRVLVLFVLVPYSLMAAKFIRYSLPMLASVDLMAAVGLVSGVGWILRKQWLSLVARATVAALVVGVFFGQLAAAQVTAAPFYSLYQNGIGARVDPGGASFSEQTYDYGVRESVEAIASVAARRALILTDAPAVAAHYVARDGRPDIDVLSLSAHGILKTSRDTWVIVQDEHATFENALVVAQLAAARTPWAEFRMDDVVAARVFRLQEKQP
jgi:4-amino-4-deoxy-L-arabinose transferase-like glycosyltransferase